MFLSISIRANSDISLFQPRLIQAMVDLGLTRGLHLTDEILIIFKIIIINE